MRDTIALDEVLHFGGRPCQKNRHFKLTHYPNQCESGCWSPRAATKPICLTCNGLGCIRVPIQEIKTEIPAISSYAGVAMKLKLMWHRLGAGSLRMWPMERRKSMIRNALKIQGWMSKEELCWLAEQASEHSTIVEIGSWFGRSTRALADNCLDMVFAVDTWLGSDETVPREILNEKPERWLYEQFCRNLADRLLPDGEILREYGGERTVHAVRMDSVSAAAWMAKRGVKPDFIFVDGSHSYADVKADIDAWRPLLAQGGLLAGHDSNDPGVQAALNDRLSGWRGAGAGSIWVAI